MSTKLLQLFFVAFIISINSHAQILINEVMSSNVSTIMDPDAEYQDWIEIYNAGTTNVNINNYSLSDNPDSLSKWKFPSMTINAGTFVTIWCSGKNIRTANNLHTNFSLKQVGEQLFLCNASAVILDNVSLPFIPSDKTYGRLPNGSATWQYLSKPTYKLTNNTAVAMTGAITTKPNFNIPGGFYATSQNIVLSHPDPTYTIRYTLDGSEPTDLSPVYSAPINVHSRVGEPNYYSLIRTGYPTHTYLPTWNPPIGEVFKCNIVRARAFKSGYFPGPVQTYTYFVDPNIFSRYGNLPLVSVVSDPKNLFNDTTGIYVPGLTYTQTGNTGNYHNNWERPANIEIYRSDGFSEVNDNFRIAVGGENTESSPQKSLNVTAKEDYGVGKINYPLFENTPGKAKYIHKFDKIKLRAWGTDRKYGLLHDGFCNSFMTQTNIDYSAYQLCILFIDGEYWGLQEIRERNRSGQYYESHYYVDKNSPGYDIINGGGNVVAEGDAVNWDATWAYINGHPMNNTTNYDYVKTQMDVDNFALYCMYSIYFSRADWPDENEAKWRPRIANGKWKWIQWDMDNTIATDLLPTYDMFKQAINGSGGYGPSPLLKKLVTGPEFKNTLINYFADYMNTIFLPQIAQAKLDSMANQLRPYMQEYKNRWQVNTTWETRLDSMDWFLNLRPANVKKQIMATFNVSDTIRLTLTVSDSTKGNIKINSILLDRNTPRVTTYTYPWTGTYFKSIPVPLTAIPKPGYKFVMWLPSNVPNASIIYTPTATSTITAVFDIDPNYHAVVKPLINEAMTSNTTVITDNRGDYDDWIEILNPGTDTINLAGYYLSSNLVLPTRFKIASGNDSTKIAPGGHLLFWMDNNLTQGVLHASFKLGSGGDFVALFAPDGETLVDSITIAAIPPNTSYGRASDGNPQWIIFSVTTPRAVNCPIPVNISASANSVCMGQTVNLQSSALGNVTSWSWAGPNGFSSSSQNPSFTISQSNQAGVYTVTASNSCGSNTASYSVVINPPFTSISATASSNTICTGQTLTLNGVVTGTATNWNWAGPNGYTSNLQNPQLGISQSSQAGTYTMTASNSCGSMTASTSVAVNVTLSNAAATTAANPVCTGQIISLNGSVIGTPATWSWVGPNGYTSSAQNPSLNLTLSNQSGTYTMTATNICGSVTASIPLTVNTTLTNPLASASVNPICTGQTLTLNSSVNGNATSWDWTGPGGYSTTQQNPQINIFQTLQAGIYTVTASNNCGSVTASTSVSVNASLSNASASATANPICTGQNISLLSSTTGNANTWSWVGPNGYSSTSQNPTLNITSTNQSGTYTVTASNTCGSTSASMSLVVNIGLTNPSATASSSTLCTGDALSLTGSVSGNASSWSWTGPGGYTSTQQNPQITITQTGQAGTYTMTATNSCGSTTSSATVAVNATITNVSGMASSNPTCPGQTVTLNGSTTGNATSWNWAGPNGYNSTAQNPVLNIANASQAGTYTVTATNMCGSLSSTLSLIISAALSNPVVTASSNSICTGQTLTLNSIVTGTPSSWSWTGPNNFTSTQQNPQINISQANQAGTYTATITNGCASVTASTSVAVNVSLSNATTSASTNPTCTGQNITLNAVVTGTASSWSWTGPNAFSSTSQNPVVNVTQTNQGGIYTVTATNLCGSITSSVSLVVSTSLSNVTATSSSSTLCTGQTLNLFGGVTGTPTSWSWTGPSGFTSSSQNPIINLTSTSQSGTYTVTATNGCLSLSASKSITVNAGLVNLTATSSASTYCTGDTLHLTGTAGGSPTSWNWSGPSGFNSTSHNPSLNITSPNQAGQYTLTATTTSCGNYTASTSIIVHEKLTNISASVSPNTSCTGHTITLNSTVTGTATNWYWTGPNNFIATTQGAPINLTDTSLSGVYHVVASNSCGSVTASATVNVIESISNLFASASTTGPCIGTTLTLQGNAVGNVTSWSWVGPGGYTSSQPDPSLGITQSGQSGDYILTATNACGSLSDTININTSGTSPTSVSIAINATQFCIDDTLYLNGNANGIIGDWSWSGPFGFSDISRDVWTIITQGSQTGTYVLTASNGCGSTSDSVNIEVLIEPDYMSIFPSANPACIGSTITLSGYSISPVSLWEWEGPNGYTYNSQTASLFVADSSVAGNYSVTASNMCGVASTNIDIGVLASPVLQPLTIANDYASIQLADITDSIQWYYGGSPVGNNDDSLFCIGDGEYFCIVTDANGCTANSDTATMICTITGINNLSNESFVKVYPNPIRDKIIVSGNLPYDKYIVTLTNALGQNLKMQELVVRTNPFNIEMNLNDVNAGIYFVTVKSKRYQEVIKVSKE